MYKEDSTPPNGSFHVAVSASPAGELPTLPQLMRNIAFALGSRFKFYESERKLCKVFKNSKTNITDWAEDLRHL